MGDWNVFVVLMGYRAMGLVDERVVCGRNIDRRGERASDEKWARNGPDQSDYYLIVHYYRSQGQRQAAGDRLLLYVVLRTFEQARREGQQEWVTKEGDWTGTGHKRPGADCKRVGLRFGFWLGEQGP